VALSQSSKSIERSHLLKEQFKIEATFDAQTSIAFAAAF
jgi:hypothetical protein